jgi:hypothetical protein
MPDFDDLVLTLEKVRGAIEGMQLDRSIILGMEVTQAIQYYDSAAHLTDPDDRGNDNAATLVAYKPALVRVYVRAQSGGGSPVSISGKLTVERGRPYGPVRPVSTLTPSFGTGVVPRDDSYGNRRANLWETLNFRIPAADFVGAMRLTVTLDTGESRSVSVTAALLQTLRVRLILFSYQGPSTSVSTATNVTQLNLPAPSLADAQSTAAVALTAMPVQQTASFAVAATLPWSLPLDDARTGPGECSANWFLLLDEIERARDNDGNQPDVVYYGLLPSGVPLNVPGCGRPERGYGAGVAGDGVTFVHEIGHGYGFEHTPSVAVGAPDPAGNTDPAYPDHEPYLRGSIGEYGVDVQSGAIFAPDSTTDYMGYGTMRWMSLYQHNRLISHPRLAPSWIRDKDPFRDLPIEYNREELWWPNPLRPVGRHVVDDYGPVISVWGRVGERGEVTVESVARFSAYFADGGNRTPWSLLLTTASGEIVSRGPLASVRSSGGKNCKCDSGADDQGADRPPFTFHAMIRDAGTDVARGASLQIVGPTGEPAWERVAPDEQVQFADVRAGVDGGSLWLDWSLSPEGSITDVWAQWSDDGGEVWHGLAVGVQSGSELSLAALPAGTSTVRLLAHDGYSTIVSNPMEVDVPRRAPEVAILYPKDGVTILAGPEVEVLGSAVDQAGRPIDGASLTWLLDGTPVGEGRALATDVEPGDHELTLTARDDPEGSATVRFHAMTMQEGADVTD